MIWSSVIKYVVRSFCIALIKYSWSDLFPVGYEASEGDGAAGEKPERAVGQTGEAQWAGKTSKKLMNQKSLNDCSGKQSLLIRSTVVIVIRSL